jgi:hypothetical protein
VDVGGTSAVPQFIRSAELSYRAANFAAIAVAVDGMAEEWAGLVTTTDGGTNAAYGFNFQFVTTAEFFLRHLRENFDKVGTIALHIESASLAESKEHDDIVDFAIEEDAVIKRPAPSPDTAGSSASPA